MKQKLQIKTRVFIPMVLMRKIKGENTENDAVKPRDLSGIFPQCYFSRQHCHLFITSHESFIHKHAQEAPQTPDRQLRHVKILRGSLKIPSDSTGSAWEFQAFPSPREWDFGVQQNNTANPHTSVKWACWSYTWSQKNTKTLKKKSRRSGSRDKETPLVNKTQIKKLPKQICN